MKIKLILILIFSAIVSAEEVNISATNTMKLGIGREWAGDEANGVELSKQYFEDWIDIEMVKGDFTAGLRYEAADSSQHNEALNEITKLYFNYSKNKINVTAGDFYGFFGRGVVFGLKESKADFFNSKVTGGKFEYSGKNFGFKAQGGKSYFKYINDYYPAEQIVDRFDNSILGSEIILPLSDYFGMEEIYLRIGCSYLYIKGDYVPENQYLYEEMFIKESNIGGISFEINAYDFDFFNEYAIKKTERTPSQTGWANYSSLNYAIKGFSIGLEFKDYYKYGANPNEPSSGFTPYQNAPELIIVHSSHLLNTHPHEVNPNDEIGYKLTAMYQLKDNIDMNGTFALASKHNEDGIIPESSEDYLPYLDSWIGANYTEENFGITFGLGYFLDSPLAKGVNQLIIPGEDNSAKVYSDKRNTYMGEYTLKLNETSKIALCGEFQSVINEYLDKEYNDIYGSVEYAYSPWGYINLSLITTSQKVTGDAPDSWLGIETGINIMENHKLELFYGRERAGIKCAGGTCRKVPEFDGFKMTLISEFN
ncbi:MAG: hypothetical protein KKD38_05325 [Candidatus Delongbacteria bacterium]|nr:hypothetical protein [Candidatus Delongbacteria bacterium]MCG2759949.1 DUF6029 family protein [Candidatus Delongbacteria bacterium]